MCLQAMSIMLLLSVVHCVSLMMTISFPVISDCFPSFLDVTAVCILEGFQNQQSMLLADKVLKLLGKEKAKEKYKVIYFGKGDSGAIYWYSVCCTFWMKKVMLLP